MMIFMSRTINLESLPGQALAADPYRNDAEPKALLAKRPSETALDPDFPIAHHTIIAGIDRGASGLN
jgi:hypothetical protein